VGEVVARKMSEEEEEEEGAPSHVGRNCGEGHNIKKMVVSEDGEQWIAHYLRTTTTRRQHDGPRTTPWRRERDENLQTLNQ
jgi:hypothetical protein